MGTELMAEERAPSINEYQDDEELTEANVIRSLVNEIPSIEFSERINQILVEHMALTMVVKLFGRSIGYVALYNKVCSLWKPLKPFRLMDVENGYFLARFQSSEDFKRV